jgi:hypothetical protein
MMRISIPTKTPNPLGLQVLVPGHGVGTVSDYRENGGNDGQKR